VIDGSDFSQLPPDVIHPRTGVAIWSKRCDAIREGPYANDRIEGAKDIEYFRCHLKSKFSVCGHNVCVRHAGLLALDRVLGVESRIIFWQDDMTKERLKQRVLRGGDRW